MALITPSSKQKWAQGTPADWAKESYDHAKDTAYAGVVDQQPVRSDFVFKDTHGQPDNRCGPSKVYKISSNYDKDAKTVVKEQLAKAAVRLAWLLKQNL